MSYDEEVANRLRECVAAQPGLTERRMFGGLAFLIDGNMAVCAAGHGSVMVRVDPVQAEELLDDAKAERMVMNGRELNGWLLVHLGADAPQAAFARWADIGVTYARTLPPK